MTILRSRFVNSKSYRTYVLFNPNTEGRNAILGYYCDCKVGTRTVGCCSHVMTMLFYFGFVYHEGIQITQTAAHLDNVFRFNLDDEFDSDEAD